jgi:hypothetical protein
MDRTTGTVPSADVRPRCFRQRCPLLRKLGVGDMQHDGGEIHIIGAAGEGDYRDRYDPTTE